MDPNIRFNENTSLVPFIYHKHFYAYSEHMDDLFQEGYAALWKSCTNFDESRGLQFSTYACTAIYRRMYGYVKKVIQKHFFVLSLDGVIAEDGEGNEVYLKDVIPKEQDDSIRYAIQESLQHIPSKDQDIICRIMEGYTQEKIAEIMHVSQSYVSRCLQRFRKILLEELK